jgi:sugar/nucleoside kinase (ribokinase family)
MAKAARAAGTIVTIDIDSPVSGYERLLELVDVCIVSDHFPQKAFGLAEAEEALSAICDRFGCGVAGITLGEKGSIFLSDGKLIRTDAFPVPGGCVDTTGAGDAFRTGFIYGILRGDEVENCALYANAVASLKCRAIGARTGLPTAKELQTMLKKYWTTPGSMP